MLPKMLMAPMIEVHLLELNNWKKGIRFIITHTHTEIDFVFASQEICVFFLAIYLQQAKHVMSTSESNLQLRRLMSHEIHIVSNEIML